MEDQRKENIKFQLATTLRGILKKKKKIAEKNKANKIEDIRLVESIRKLEAESGLSYNVIQNVFVGKRDIQFTTLINIIESLDYSFSDFAKLYDKITADQIEIEKLAIKNKATSKTK